MNITSDVVAFFQPSAHKLSTFFEIFFLKAAIDAKIAEATPIVQAALAKVQAAVDEMIAKVQAQI